MRFYSFYAAAMTCFHISGSASLCGQITKSQNLTSWFPDQFHVCKFDGLSQEELLKLLTLNTSNLQSRDLDLHVASEALEIFVAVLKSFVRESCYDGNVRLKTCRKHFQSAEFATHERFLGATFSTLSNVVKTFFAKDNMIARQFEFSSYMFQAMKESLRMLRFYTFSKNPARRLVHKMIQLNVQMLTLYDSTGMPDRDSKSYEKEVAECFRSLNLWTRSFAILNDVSPSTRVFFRSQRSKAETTIQILKRKPEKIGGGQPLVSKSPKTRGRQSC
ncbi:hypothetical protein OXX79_001098 [Metschnikowia pulcherrima]